VKMGALGLIKSVRPPLPPSHTNTKKLYHIVPCAFINVDDLITP